MADLLVNRPPNWPTWPKMPPKGPILVPFWVQNPRPPRDFGPKIWGQNPESPILDFGLKTEKSPSPTHENHEIFGIPETWSILDPQKWPPKTTPKMTQNLPSKSILAQKMTQNFWPFFGMSPKSDIPKNDPFLAQNWPPYDILAPKWPKNASFLGPKMPISDHLGPKNDSKNPPFLAPKFASQPTQLKQL